MKYIKLAYYNLKEIFYYSYTLLFRSLWLLLIIFLLNSIVTYWASLKWVSYVWWIFIWIYIWYVFLTELLMSCRRDEDMINSIKSWDIILFLNKPLNFFLYSVLTSFFKTFIKMSILGTFVWVIIFLFIHNFPWFWISTILLSLLSVWIWILTLSSISFAIGCISFVVEDSYFLRFAINKIYLILGWVFFPMEIYPSCLQTISKYLPFQYFFYGPAKFFTTWDIEFFLNYFPIQIVWLIVILTIVFFSYWILIKKLEVNWG